MGTELSRKSVDVVGVATPNGPCRMVHEEQPVSSVARSRAPLLPALATRSSESQSARPRPTTGPVPPSAPHRLTAPMVCQRPPTGDEEVGPRQGLGAHIVLERRGVTLGCLPIRPRSSVASMASRRNQRTLWARQPARTTASPSASASTPRRLAAGRRRLGRQHARPDKANAGLPAQPKRLYQDRLRLAPSSSVVPKRAPELVEDVGAVTPVAEALHDASAPCPGHRRRLPKVALVGQELPE